LPNKPCAICIVPVHCDKVVVGLYMEVREMRNKAIRVAALLFRLAAVMTVLLISFGCGPEKKKSYLIGYVNPNPLEKEGAQGFLDNMPEFGYVEGKNLSYIKCETRDKKQIEAAIREMVAKKVDLIFTMTTPATKLAKELTAGTNIPVVFALYNALQSEVVDSISRPGGNLTGVQYMGSTLKSLDWMLAIKPHADHILVPICYDTGAAKQSLADLQAAAQKIHIKVTVAEVNTTAELTARLASMSPDIDAIFILHSWLVGSHVDLIAKTVKDRNILIFSAGHVDYAGGVAMSYAPTDNHTGWQAARLVHSILQGAPPSALPVETAYFFLGINLKTAQTTGVDIPEDVLRLADFILR
jgi:putative ABC transport system substrate-binding protein